MKRNVLIIIAVAAAVMLSSCRNPQVPANLQEKLDSIKTLEQLEQLRAQGISLEEASPMQQFYDSLAVQALPLSYSEDYVAMLPNYQPVPQALVQLMNFEGRMNPMAIALPETISKRLMILAADEGDGRYSLWLYVLDSEYFPTDKLCLYSPKRQAQEPDDQSTMEFSITSAYEIFLTTYTADHKTKRQRLFVINDAQKFVELIPQ